MVRLRDRDTDTLPAGVSVAAIMRVISWLTETLSFTDGKILPVNIGVIRAAAAALLLVMLVLRTWLAVLGSRVFSPFLPPVNGPQAEVHGVVNKEDKENDDDDQDEDDDEDDHGVELVVDADVPGPHPLPLTISCDH